MSLNKTEKAILEAVNGLLQQDVRLGLSIHNGPTGFGETTDHTSQFRWEGIDDLFTLKVSGSPFKDSLTSAFFAVHSHKYIDNPTFKLSFDKEMKARALPTHVREESLKHVDNIIEDLSAKKPSELDSGWNPDMKGIVDVTSNADHHDAKATEPFTGGGPAPDGKHDLGKQIE
jgi:hypothetical protein